MSSIDDIISVCFGLNIGYDKSNMRSFCIPCVWYIGFNVTVNLRRGFNECLQLKACIQNLSKIQRHLHDCNAGTLDTFAWWCC
jgi:hypothetical protein